MTDLDRLKTQYRSIAAPAALRVRLRSALAGRSPPRRRLVPALAAAAAVMVAALALAPVLLHRAAPTTIGPTPRTPSLSALSRIDVSRPAALPSLSQLRGVTPPPLPPKPEAGAEKHGVSPDDSTTAIYEETHREHA